MGVHGVWRPCLLEGIPRGELPHFTGVSDPYEPPPRPDVVVRTDAEPVETSAERILDHLRARGLLRTAVERKAS